jgi:hypothetical protein
VRERLAQQPAQVVAVLPAQAREHLVLDALHRALGALDRPLAGRRDADDVAPAIVGITAALDPAVGLEVVEEEDQVVRIHVEGLPQLLLEQGSVLADVAERPELLDAHAQELLGAAPVDDAREAREQHQRARSGGGLHPRCGA